jgi:hypothetical protein
MTPYTHTLYAITLFLALVMQGQWLKRRQRASRGLRQAVASLEQPKAS